MLPIESSTSTMLASSILEMNADTAEALAGPFFGLSLFPYLAFLYFLDHPVNDTPKGVSVGFATCLLFVFLTIPAAIAAKLLYGVSLADCDWLHGSAESLLTMTNLVTVVAFRQALQGKDVGRMPESATSYGPMVALVVGLTLLAVLTAIVPALDPATTVHTPYLAGVLDVPLGPPQPDNALTIATWIIHVSSLVEFLVAMGFCWRWADVVDNPKWKGLTWGLLPLHSSGITACTYHLFYNQNSVLVTLQALLTCVGNATAAYAAYRLARSNGWSPQDLPMVAGWFPETETVQSPMATTDKEESKSLVGFEDLGEALAADNDYTFLIKLFAGCAVASYAIKYGELYFDFPFEANPWLALSVIGVPSALNAFKWYKRSQDPSFEGWF